MICNKLIIGYFLNDHQLHLKISPQKSIKTAVKFILCYILLQAITPNDHCVGTEDNSNTMHAMTHK